MTMEQLENKPFCSSIRIQGYPFFMFCLFKCWSFSYSRFHFAYRYQAILDDGNQKSYKLLRKSINAQKPTVFKA